MGQAKKHKICSKCHELHQGAAYSHWNVSGDLPRAKAAQKTAMGPLKGPFALYRTLYGTLAYGAHMRPFKGPYTAPWKSPKNGERRKCRQTVLSALSVFHLFLSISSDLCLWFEFGFSLVLVWFLSGLSLVLVWFEFGFSLVRVWV